MSSEQPSAETLAAGAAAARRAATIALFGVARDQRAVPAVARDIASYWWCRLQRAPAQAALPAVEWGVFAWAGLSALERVAGGVPWLARLSARRVPIAVAVTAAAWASAVADKHGPAAATCSLCAMASASPVGVAMRAAYAAVAAHDPAVLAAADAVAATEAGVPTDDPAATFAARRAALRARLFGEAGGAPAGASSSGAQSALVGVRDGGDGGSGDVDEDAEHVGFDDTEKDDSRGASAGVVPPPAVPTRDGRRGGPRAPGAARATPVLAADVDGGDADAPWEAQAPWEAGAEWADDAGGPQGGPSGRRGAAPSAPPLASWETRRHARDELRRRAHAPAAGGEARAAPRRAAGARDDFRAGPRRGDSGGFADDGDPAAQGLVIEYEDSSDDKLRM